MAVEDSLLNAEKYYTMPGRLFLFQRLTFQNTQQS
jgi:hypothetical protein